MFDIASRNKRVWLDEWISLFVSVFAMQHWGAAVWETYVNAMQTINIRNATNIPQEFYENKAIIVVNLRLS